MPSHASARGPRVNRSIVMMVMLFHLVRGSGKGKRLCSIPHEAPYGRGGPIDGSAGRIASASPRKALGPTQPASASAAWSPHWDCRTERLYSDSQKFFLNGVLRRTRISSSDRCKHTFVTRPMTASPVDGGNIIKRNSARHETISRNADWYQLPA
jgi:hypothetical protein